MILRRVNCKAEYSEYCRMFGVLKNAFCAIHLLRGVASSGVQGIHAELAPGCRQQARLLVGRLSSILIEVSIVLLPITPESVLYHAPTQTIYHS